MKKILISLSIIGIVGAMAIGGTIAYFQDIETSAGNTFTAGTLDLQIKDANEVWGDGVTATWVENNFKPGDVSGTNSIYLKNVGSIEADHIEISVVNIVSDPVCEESDTNCLTGDMDKWIEIIEMYYEGSNVLIGLLDNNVNGWKDLDDLESQGLDNLAPPPAVGGGTKTFTAQFKFRADAGNDFQGDVVTSAFTFRLHQHSSQ